MLRHSCIFVILSLLLLIFPACNKPEDPDDPVITVVSPSENQMFNVFDTIHVKASISCGDQLSGIQLSLVDEKLVAVLPTYTVSLDASTHNTWNVDVYIPIDAIQLKSGNYFLWIRASTSLSYRNKYLPIRIIEVKKRLKNILLLTRSNVNTTSLFSLDCTLQLRHLFDFSQDFCQAAIDPGNRLLYVAGRQTGLLTAYELDSNRIRWQKSGAGTAELPYYQDIRMEAGHIMVSSSDGKLQEFDAQGSLTFYKDFGFVQYPVRNCVVNNLIITAVAQKNGPLRYLNNYFYPSGAYQSGIQVPFSTVSILKITSQELLVTANEAGEGTLRYYYPGDPGLWTPVTFPGGTISKTIEGSEGNFFIQTPQNVYWFQSGSHTLTTFVSGNAMVDLAWDDISGQLITAGHNSLNFYSFPQSVLLNTITVPDSLKACLLWYNK